MSGVEPCRVVAALSGGVDSAVAAARLVAEGHEVVGVHLALKIDASGRGCGSPRDVADAEAAARRLGIRFEVWDFADAFRSQVVDHFLDEYAHGRTPNPCLRCNSLIKFDALLTGALARGFDAVGTGHWARLDPAPGVLRRAANRAKDQSYVLAVLRPEQLRHCRFPLGDVPDKAAVRAEATALGLAEVAAKPDSLDICFIPDGDTAGFLRRHLGEAPGEIVDVDGRVLGQHTGTHQFTVGQRKGLRLGRPAADGRPRFVLEIQPDRRRVVVGPKEAGAVRKITAASPVWHVPAVDRECVVQIRAHGEELRARVSPTAEAVSVELLEPVTGVAAGQGLVAYDGDRVLLHATIDQTR